MTLSFATLLLASAAAFANSADAAAANLFSRGTVDGFSAQFLKKIPQSPIVKMQQWEDALPLSCRYEALGSTQYRTKAKCTLEKLAVKEVWYADSPDSWVFCYCQGSPFKEEELMSQFGKIEIGIRQRVRHVMGFNGGGASWASSENDITMNFLTYAALLHEAGHCFDDYEKRGSATGGFSNSAEWKEARNKDTCVSDSYASTSQAEGWAQTLVIRRYQALIGTLPKDASCMQNQLNVLASQTDGFVKAGYSKDRKIPHGQIVTKDNGSKVSGPSKITPLQIPASLGGSGSAPVPVNPVPVNPAPVASTSKPAPVATSIPTNAPVKPSPVPGPVLGGGSGSGPTRPGQGGSDNPGQGQGGQIDFEKLVARLKSILAKIKASQGQGGSAAPFGWKRIVKRVIGAQGDESTCGGFTKPSPDDE